MEMIADAICPRRRIAQLFAFLALVLAVVALAVLFLAPPDALGQNASPSAALAKAGAAPAPAPAAAAAQAAGEPRSRGGMHEGLTVHGHWVIEVKNPDGTVVSQTTFENKLINPSFLSSLLTGGASAGTWEVDLGSNLGSTPCGQTVCRLVEPGSLFNRSCTTPPAASNLECWLTVTVPASGASAGDIVLTGSTIALQAGSINVASSDIISCGNTVSPATCDHGSGGTTGLINSFTEATGFPGSPIDVTAAGQTITATVTISFQ